MGKFFVPAKWEKVGDAIKFKSLRAADSSQAQKNKSKKNKKKKCEDIQITTGLKPQPKQLQQQGKGPLAPSSSENKLNKIKSGRIEKRKNKNQIKLKASWTDDDETKTKTNTTTGSLEARLKEQLMGGRFRFLNEQLYTMDSTNAEKLFHDDPQAFEAYHAGYRHQVEKWPINPLNRIIKTIRRLPKSLEIGDFGCGEGKLAKSIPNNVHSMDLVSCREDIIACDMANTPLTPQSLDVAVYCLSLMGTNLKDYILEANRVLKIGGIMLIAEIQSRFDDLRQFIRCLEACGFELVKKDVSVKVFYFFEFKKIRNVGKISIIPSCELKPCLYRKR